MADQRTDSFIIPIQIEENVTNALKQLVTTTSKGVAIGISMESDAGKVIEDIHKISKELEAAIGKKDFNMDKLLNLNNAIAKLGAFKGEVEGLETIFNTLTSSVTSLNGAMTEIASVKMDTKQFVAFQNALSSISTNVEAIAKKLGAIDGSNSLKNINQDAKNAAEGIKEAAAATDELNKKQAESVNVSEDPNMGKTYGFVQKRIETLTQKTNEYSEVQARVLERAQKIDDGKHLGSAKGTNVDAYTKKIESANKTIDTLTKKLHGDITNSMELDLKSEIAYWERIVIDCEKVISNIKGLGDPSDRQARIASADTDNRAVKKEIQDTLDAARAEKQMWEEVAAKKREANSADYIKYSEEQAVKAQEAARIEAEAAQKAAQAEELKKQRIIDNVTEYQNLGLQVDSLTEKQRVLQEVCNNIPKVDLTGITKDNVLTTMVDKANEFYSLLEASDQPVDEVKARIIQLVSEIKVLTTEYANVFDANRGYTLANGNGLGAVSYTMSKYDPTVELKTVNKDIEDLEKKKQQALNRIGALSGTSSEEALNIVQQTIQALQKEQQAQQQASTAAKEAGNAQANAQNNNQQELKETLVSLEQIEQAYQRMQSQKDWDKASINRTLSGNYRGAGKSESNRAVVSQLKNANEAYNNSIANNWNWEEQYQWAVKFIGIYEEYQSRANHTTKSLSQHTELYNQLKPHVESYKQSLQAVLDIEQKMASGTTSAQPLQQTAQEAANTAASIEKVEQNLSEATVKAEGLEQQMADINAKAAQSVTGKVDIGNTVKVTGDGGQLALEKTLKATYHIQQNMVKIMSEINSKMVSGANAATASYEQLRAVMQETVEAAKQLGAEEEKQGAKKSNNKSKEHYAIIKKDLNEIIKLKKLLPNAGESEKKELTRQIKALNEQVRYRQQIIDKSNTQNTVEQKSVNLLREKVKLVNAQNRDKRNAALNKTKSTTSNNLESKYNTTSKILRDVSNRSPVIDTAEGRYIQTLIDKFKEYDRLLAAVDNNFKKLSNEQQAEIKESVAEFNKLSQAQKDALKAGAYNSFNASGKDYKGQFVPLDQSQIEMFNTAANDADKYKAALVSVAEKITGCKMVTAELDAAGKKLTATYQDQDKNLRQITVGYQQAGQGARVLQREMEAHKGVVKSVFEPFGNKLKEIFRYFSAYMVVMRFFNAFKQGVQYVRELNTALTEMQLVTESTADEMARIEKEIQKVAASVASTNVDIAQSATDWAKLGYSMSDALELAGVSAQYAKVGFTDVATASENLTATMQGFYSKELASGLIDAGELAETLTDKFVDVGNKFASSAEGLGQGMTAASAALVAAGENYCSNNMETYYCRTHLIAKTA